jgi:hypothetical protein
MSALRDNLKKELRSITDNVDTETLQKIVETIRCELSKGRENTIPEVEPTEEEQKAITEANDRITKGSYDTLEDFLKEVEGKE